MWWQFCNMDDFNNDSFTEIILESWFQWWFFVKLSLFHFSSSKLKWLISHILTHSPSHQCIEIKERDNPKLKPLKFCLRDGHASTKDTKERMAGVEHLHQLLEASRKSLSSSKVTSLIDTRMDLLKNNNFCVS